MKKLKYIVGAFLFAMVLCLPVALVGCTKRYKVNVSIVAGHGSVYTVESLNPENYHSLLGENEVTKGCKFEFIVAPDTNYSISYIKVNGNKIYSKENPGNFSTTDDGSLIPCITINSKTQIDIAFEAVTFTASKLFYNSGTKDSPNWMILTTTGEEEQTGEDVDRKLSMPYDKVLRSKTPQQFNGIEVSKNVSEDSSTIDLRKQDVDFSEFKLIDNNDLYFNCTAAELITLLDSFELV